MKVNLNKILKKGKGVFLAYDQGLEHGPKDFNDKNADPNYIIEIATLKNTAEYRKSFYDLVVEPPFDYFVNENVDQVTRFFKFEKELANSAEIIEFPLKKD